MAEGICCPASRGQTDCQSWKNSFPTLTHTTVGVITMGTQSALKPCLKQPHLGTVSGKILTRQLTHPFCTYSSVKTRQSSNPDWDNEGILPFLLKSWQMSPRCLRAAIRANTVNGVCEGISPVTVQHIVCTSILAHLHTMLNSTCSRAVLPNSTH